MLRLFMIILFLICGVINSKIYSKTAEIRESGVPGGYNLVIIMLDSVRADHLSCYGYNRKTSPGIDALAKEGILFEYAIAHSTWSLPSHCSIFTSKFPPSHNVVSTFRKLKDSEVTLAEILKIYGYKTAAFTGGLWTQSVFNLGQGFDIYYDAFSFGKLKDTMPLAIEWLQSNKLNKFFLFIQGLDGHSPFELPEPYDSMYVDSKYDGIFKKITLDHRISNRLSGNTFFLDKEHGQGVVVTEKDIGYIIAKYDASIAFADKNISEFLKKMDELNLRNNTIVILTSYHGTPLFEHGIILKRYHGRKPTEGVIHVPFIIRHPQLNKKGLRIKTQVQHVDILPTILDFLHIPLNRETQGNSLDTLLKGKVSPEFNKYVYSSDSGWRAIRTQKWKLICGEEADKCELYNLQKDPLEQNNLIARRQKIAQRLKKKLDEWYGKVRVVGPQKDANQVPKEELGKIKKQLREAGYWFLERDK